MITKRLFLAFAVIGCSTELANAADFVNSVGQRMVQLMPGTFLMGSRQGDRDEETLHYVTISREFHLGATEVTNRQYEEFDPAHRKLRGKLGFSTADDEAVVFVNWVDATAYCAWLAKKEGKSYRLPTEAEWEYACRAGTTTEFNTGAEFPVEQQNNQILSWYPDPARSDGELENVRSLHVGQYPANAWGLHDMHGNVEEWCSDWYGPYIAGAQKDPVGLSDGEFRVTRGGAHSMELPYLRSANRAGTIPQDRTWVIGFRLAMGPTSATPPLPPMAPELYAQNVDQRHRTIMPRSVDTAKPLFRGPRTYVRVTPTPRGPFFKHNHVPSLTELPNGDLLAIWYTTNREKTRELHYVASRLRYGAAEWEPASESFFSPPDRNAHAGVVWWDGVDTIWHFNGLSVGGTWGSLALVARTSRDNGVTWTKSHFINAEHGSRRMLVASVVHTRSGAIVLSADVPGRKKPAGDGGCAVWVSTDGGKTFNDPGAGRPDPEFVPGKTGAWIAGIHAPIAETADGRGIVSFGRRDQNPDNLLRSVSYDLGKTWEYSSSLIEALGSGQRPTILRLQDGSLFLASFTTGMELNDIAGKTRIVKGLYAALSFDDGVTWPYRRLVTDDQTPRTFDGGAWTGKFEMGPETAEPKGYIASIQSRDGTIHLISSALHYEFNAAWIREKMPAATP
ncbi:MAG: SUMF1/EgtB/PvdO family nonheme iron enzyme [Opitutaceae bacterium]|nr:SUMF1/EgtB/PvdO family nonheme iron enzyme [Opitutaceae bacterium]